MNNKKTHSVFIYNPIEDEWPFISSLPLRKQKDYIESSNRFADCYLFANASLPSFTLITPIQLDSEFISYFQTLSGSSCTVLTPRSTSPFLCESIVNDSLIFKQLIQESKKMGSITLYAYAISSQLFVLIKKLKKAGVIVYLPEGPLEKDLWTIEQFGSKAGFRKFFAHLMPPGAIYKKISSARVDAKKRFIEGEGVVLKTDRGNAGNGVFIFKKDPTETDKTIGKHIQNIFIKHPYLKKHALVVEDFINTSNEKRCPFPSIECFIHQDGRIEIPYYCNMIVSPEGEFYGMEMHESVFTKKIKSAVFAITREIAKTYRENGYRGRFDVDMICDGANVYADESNTRINGGTDTYMIVKKLIGESFFSSRYVFAHYLAIVPPNSHTLKTILELCKSLLYNAKTKRGMVINSGSAIASGGLSYIIIEKSKALALKMNEQLKVLMTQKK